MAQASPNSAQAKAKAASAASAAAGKSKSAADFGEQQALRQAKLSGKAVQVAAATTAASTLTANPNGTLTLNQNIAPVRKKVNGSWANLDSTLVMQPDGSVGPKVSMDQLVLSGGGNGPLATMSSGGDSLGFGLPVTLPKPTLSGNTALYANVLPSVDLRVTADPQGGFREVLVVKNAKAAADPRLQDLELATHASGVTLSADATGNLTAKDRKGHAVYTAQAPQMWDSAAAAGTNHAGVMNPLTGQLVDRTSGAPLASTASGPGKGAHSARIGVKLTSKGLDLRPDTTMLGSGSTVFPVYIDPSFVAPTAATPLSAWTQTNTYWSSSSYWKSSDLLRVGDQNWQSPTFVARSYVQLSIPSKIYGGTVLSSQLNFTEEWSPSCSATGVQLWSTNQINSGTVWNNQPSPVTQVGSTATVAHGYDSSCPAAAVGFDMTANMQKAANGDWPTMTLVLKAADETDEYGWKEFANTVTYSTTYDHAPSTPTTASMTTSPATSCTGSTVGDGMVSLYTKLTDPDGGDVGATYSVTNHATGAVIATSDPQKLWASSGQTVDLQLPKATLEAAANNKATQFDWKVQTTDYHFSSASWSPVCSFTFDPTRAGAPNIALPDGTTCGTNPGTVVGTIGQKSTFTLTPSSGAPTQYVYQLNGGTPHSLTATSGSVSITPTRFTNVLSVSTLTAGGNYGDRAVCVFNSATPSTPAAANDLTGGGVADLLGVGSQNTVPAGLWLASGQAGPGQKGDGHINASATDIGMYGSGINANGTSGTGSPSDYNGAIAFSGLFTRDNLQDVLVYYPSGAHAGTGEIVPGNGDGSALDDTATHNILSGALADANSDSPVQLANADNITGDNTSATPAFPDLIGVAGDATNGYSLEIYAGDSGTIGSYDGGQGSLGNSIMLTTQTPAGDANWQNWTLASTQIPGTGTYAGTDLYLWNKTSGDLYLWSGLSATYNSTNSVWSLAYTQSKIASGWHTGTAEALQAADVNGDGTPDLWSTDSTGTVTANLLTTGNVFAANPPTDPLVALTHEWDLTDQNTGTVGANAASDLSGNLPLSGNTGPATGSPLPAWNTGSLFNPDVKINGTTSATTSTLTASGSAVNVGSDFSVSVWANPQTTGGVTLSQSGSKDSGFVLYPSASGWTFCMAKADTGPWNDDCITDTAVPVQLGAWTHLAATYNKAGSLMSLYVNGVEAIAGNHTAIAGFTGAFTIGDDLVNGAGNAYYSGEVSQVQTWSKTLTPGQITAVDNIGTPINTGLFPADSSTYPSGSSWTQGAAVMSFNQGLLTVTTGGTQMWTMGASGYPNAVLTLQNDGNLVIYDNAADAAAANTGAIAASGTGGNAGDTLLFQADGNVVIYTSTGQPIWATMTDYPGADRWQLNGSGQDDAGTNPATPSSGVSWAANHTGATNAAAVFNGSSTVRAEAPAVNTAGSYTVSAWVKLSTLATTQTVLSQGTNNHQAFYLGYDQAKNAWYFMTTTTDDSTTAYPEASGGWAEVGQWTHLSGSYDAGTHTMTLYVNGVNVGTATNSTPVASVGPLQVGANSLPATPTSLYNATSGSVSDVRTYQTALSAAQVNTATNLPEGQSHYTFSDVVDWYGNGTQDMIAEDSSGYLWVIPLGQNTSTPTRTEIGTGWGGYTFAGVADLNNDGYPDVIAVDSSGNMWVYPGDANHDLKTPRVEIGVGWGTFSIAGVRDWNGDGKVDIVAKDSAGTLWMYPGTGTINGFSTMGSRVQIGTGWSTYTLDGLADWNKDGRMDLIARDSSGNLWLYAGDAAHDTSGGRTQIGSGWSSSYTIAGIADATGDGNPDVIARDPSNVLYVYPGGGTAISISPRIPVGVGW